VPRHETKCWRRSTASASGYSGVAGEPVGQYESACMLIYKPIGGDPYELCQPVDPEDYETIECRLTGQPQAATWKPITMHLIRDDQGRQLSPSPAPWLGSYAWVLRPEAILAMGSLLREYGELLPLSCHGAKLMLFHCLTIVDALDEDASDVHYFAEGHIMGVLHYVLRAKAIGAAEIFTLANLPAGPIFVGQRFVDMWRNAGLEGLDFPRIDIID